MLAAAALAEDGVDFVDEDDRGLELARKAEHRGDELIGVAVPLLGYGADVQVYEAGAGLVGEGFGEHGLAAARGAVKEDARGRGEERGRVAVEVREGERVDDGFFELFDYGVEAADVFISLLVQTQS